MAVVSMSGRQACSLVPSTKAWAFPFYSCPLFLPVLNDLPLFLFSVPVPSSESTFFFFSVLNFPSLHFDHMPWQTKSDRSSNSVNALLARRQHCPFPCFPESWHGARAERAGLPPASALCSTSKLFSKVERYLLLICFQMLTLELCSFPREASVPSPLLPGGQEGNTRQGHLVEP